MVAQHHTQILEIISGELPQRRLVDIILAKCRLIALQPETTQPNRYVHRRSPLTPARNADSDEVARAFRDDVARDYEMMSPGFGASLA